jgi:hypothetical protein
MYSPEFEDYTIDSDVVLQTSGTGIEEFLRTALLPSTWALGSSMWKGLKVVFFLFFFLAMLVMITSHGWLDRGKIRVAMKRSK